MLFWIFSLALAALIGAVLVRATLKGGAARPEVNADMQVYRDQLAGIDRDLARGVISAAEADRTRIEVSRRLLEADRAGVAPEKRGSPALPVIAVAVALAGSVALYLRTGAPGYPDLPISERLARAEAFRAERPSQAAAEAETVLPEHPAPDPAYADLMARLRQAVAANPDDIAGQRLLARNETALGNFAAGAEAQTRVIALAGDAATATDYATLADSYVMAAGGYVSPEAEQALASALERDPKNGTARFYTGLMWAQAGRPDLAFRFWRALLEEGPEEAPWIAPIRSQIGMLATAAGVDYTPPAAPGAQPGPDAADLAAAAQMSDEDRQGMIRSMVDRLSDRLTTEGGPPEDWARLISSLGVLGEAERAAEIWAEAQTVFAGHETELATVRAAAEQAGVAK
ncbi:c-type cytochrome biogenesis protein CcmI [Defluviimonas sp. SAOS-178_SWC]|uniref:c-type cytochrome biogenesis protein CcmI n=1 Tax=Defluviimonas sp. SAOS-178_SWC TaxID=3121287 RepID=UPI0032221F1A